MTMNLFSLEEKHAEGCVRRWMADTLTHSDAVLGNFHIFFLTYRKLRKKPSAVSVVSVLPAYWADTLEKPCVSRRRRVSAWK